MSEELLLVHVLFRHGERTPGKWTYPLDPYRKCNYFPYGYIQLTNEGKRNMYTLGLTLREMYGTLIGDMYYPGIIEAICSDFDRTKTSIQTVLSALFQPKGCMVWREGLNWQPIPFHFTPLKEDTLLAKFLDFDRLEKLTEEANKIMLDDINNSHKGMIPYIENKTGLSVTTLYYIWLLYANLESQKALGLQLPDFINSDFLSAIQDLASKYHVVLSRCKDAQRLLIGDFVKKILCDTNKGIHGGSTKLYIYGAHETNIAHLTIFLDIFIGHVPYGSCICLEIYKFEERYIMKVLRKGEDKKFSIVTFPNGKDYIEMEEFENRIKALYTD